MYYFLAIILPPLVPLFKGKFFQFILNLILCCLFWIPAIIHALFLAHEGYADKRTDRLVKALMESKMNA